ncbi:MAG: divergent polysaccharide deacetylase family protein, partial [Terricaulis sp.]
MIRPRVNLRGFAPKQPPKPARRLPKLTHKTAAFAFVGVLAVGALGAVQIFGDPGAAGPRRVLSLQPSAAEANAPRVSFSDAAEEGAEMQTFGIDELPQTGEYGEIDSNGELRVSVVESQPAATAGRPQSPPLPRAPLAGLFENGPNGPLPIIGPNGRTPAQAYARPFTAQQGRPKLAIVIGGLGFNATATTQAIDELPAEITLSFVPYTQNLQSWIDRARARGHEVMLELPMEPFDPDADDTGPQTLLASAPAAQNISRLEQLLSRGTGYF